jgi:hypothetical protein
MPSVELLKYSLVRGWGGVPYWGRGSFIKMAAGGGGKSPEGEGVTRAESPLPRYCHEI